MSPPLDCLPPRRWLAAILPATIAFFYAPLAFGGTTPETMSGLDRLLAHSIVLWPFVLILERRLPRVPWVLASALALLTLLGISQFLNPAWSIFDSEARERHIPWLPGGIETERNGLILLHLLVLALAGLVLRDGLADTRVRWFLFRAVALAGFVIAVAGIAQKAIGTDTMLWGVRIRYEGNFFAAFRYHGNAAAFLNLSWPAALAVWIRSRLVLTGRLIVSFDLYVFLIIFGAVFVNSSKAGLVLALFGFALACWRFHRELLAVRTSRSGMVVLITFLLLLIAIVAVPGSLHAFTKWKLLISEWASLTGRLDAYRACLLAISATGWYGSGAGSFFIVFPIYAQSFGIKGFWEHAHQDWLQTIMEWGWIGFAGWAVVFGGAVVRLQRRMKESQQQRLMKAARPQQRTKESTGRHRRKKRRRRANRTELTASAAWIALVVVLVHSLVDFPMQIPALQWLAVFYLAVAWSDVGKSRRKRSRTRVRNNLAGASAPSDGSTQAQSAPRLQGEPEGSENATPGIVGFRDESGAVREGEGFTQGMIDRSEGIR
jgi:O-antigen ligase